MATIISFFLFFPISVKKRKLEFINFHSVFSISFPTQSSHIPTPISRILTLSLCILTPIPRIPTQITRIPTLFPCILTPVPRIPTLIHRNSTLIPRILTQIFLFTLFILGIKIQFKNTFTSMIHHLKS